MSFFGDIGHFIMQPLYYAISFLLVGWHSLWSQVFPPTSGAAWALSIVGLTLVIRALPASAEASYAELATDLSRCLGRVSA